MCCAAAPPHLRLSLPQGGFELVTFIVVHYVGFNLVGDGRREVMYAWKTGMMSCILITLHREAMATLLIWLPMQPLANQSSKSICGKHVRYSSHSDTRTHSWPGLT